MSGYGDLEILLPALQEMNGRLEGIAQILVNQSQTIQAGAGLQQEVVRLQQHLVQLQEQVVKNPPAKPGQAAASNQTDQSLPYLNAILNGINILAEATQKRAETAQVAGTTPPEVLPNASQNDQVVAYLNAILAGINQLTEVTQKQAEVGQTRTPTTINGHAKGGIYPPHDDHKRLDDIENGAPAENNDYFGRHREHFEQQLGEDIYSKMQTPSSAPGAVPNPPSSYPYSKEDEATPPQVVPRDTRQSTLNQPFQPRQSQQPRPSRSIPSEAERNEAEQMDALFAEEAAYLDERKAHLVREEKYLDERKEHIAQKKEWYLKFG
ncbi:MAG: hypothetical protein RBG13Loki_1282 [Promethearchaeota archaeon CR_4]|nr:MAG: hypothetical protein RBG13Loki_1282 [Candidatus Lokiarchaeota archaeon CR_4]